MFLENNETENENNLDEFKFDSSQNVLVSNIPHVVENENLIIAPGQGKSPVSILNDEFCEELAFPHLFPTGKFGYKVERDIAISPIKYFNQRLLNWNQKVAADSSYVFFARSVLGQLHLQSSINIALQQIK